MRINRNQMFMEIARTVSKRSACMRLNVGAILVNAQNNIVSIGYNGPASGQPHCNEIGCEVEGRGGCKRSMHAEWNALERLSLVQWTPEAGYLRLYTTHSPCPVCTHSIFKFGYIEQVFFEVPYREMNHLETLTRHHIRVFQIIPSGQMFPYDQRP